MHQSLRKHFLSQNRPNYKSSSAETIAKQSSFQTWAHIISVVNWSHEGLQTNSQQTKIVIVQHKHNECYIVIHCRRSGTTSEYWVITTLVRSSGSKISTHTCSKFSSQVCYCQSLGHPSKSIIDEKIRELCPTVSPHPQRDGDRSCKNRHRRYHLQQVGINPEYEDVLS